MTTEIEQRVTLAAGQHVMERGKLTHPAAARDRCQAESAAFMETLAAWGVEATVVSGFMMDGDTILCGHFAVRVDATQEVWDWTARQFDPAAPVPLVTPWAEWRQQWWNPSEGWMDAVDDPVSITFDVLAMAEALDASRRAR